MFSSNTELKDLKNFTFCQSYIDKQIINFVSLIVELVPVKSVVEKGAMYWKPQKEASQKSEMTSKNWGFERRTYIVYCGNCWWLCIGGFRVNERKVCWKALKSSVSKA